jgi:hypothetical protein
MSFNRYERGSGITTVLTGRRRVHMFWSWRQKRKTFIEEPTLEQYDNMFQNVVWAREELSKLLDALAMHQEDGHDCPVYCLPPEIAHFLMQLPPSGVLVLLQVALKDSVLTEDVGDSEDEDAQ